MTVSSLRFSIFPLLKMFCFVKHLFFLVTKMNKFMHSNRKIPQYATWKIESLSYCKITVNCQQTTNESKHLKKQIIGKAIHSSPRWLAGEKKSYSYNHKTTIWVSHEYYLNSEFHKILWRAFWVIAILRFSPYVARVDFKGLISK